MGERIITYLGLGLLLALVIRHPPGVIIGSIGTQTSNVFGTLLRGSER